MSGTPSKRRMTIIIPPPAVSEALAELLSALTTQDRLEACRSLRTLFKVDAGTYESTTSTTKAGAKTILYALEAGATKMLLLQLNQVFQTTPVAVPVVEELMILLHVLTRNCPETHRERIHAQLVEHLDLLRLAFPCSIRAVVSIMHTISLTPCGAIAICQLDHRALLVHVVGYLRESTDETTLLEGLGCLKNITCYAEDERMRIFNLPEVKETLTALCFRSTSCEKSLEHLSAILRNLSISRDCRNSMIRSPDVLSAVLQLASHSSSKKLLLNVLNTLISLASMDSDACLMLLLHHDGLLLTRMRQLLVDKSDAVLRKRATRTIRLLANPLSAPLLVNDTSLMETLSHHALHDPDQAVRYEATEAFAKCAGLVRVGQGPPYQAVLNALLQLAKATSKSCGEVLARALHEQSRHDDNRIHIVKCTELLETMAKLAAAEETSRQAKVEICGALWELSNESETLERLANNPLILTALVVNVMNEFETDQQFAIDTLARLTTVVSQRATLANHPNLLQAMIQFAACTTNAESKKLAKESLLILIIEL
jgi:hypothetical protein